MDEVTTEAGRGLEFKVEKGVPYQRKQITALRYPWPDMKVGDSFVFPCAEKDKGYRQMKQSSLFSAAKSWALRNAPERRFATSMVEEGIRVWRIADKLREESK